MQNDHGDWDTVHHSFTTANALHQALARRPSPELLPRACSTARCASTSTASSTCRRPACPTAEAADLVELDAVWDVQGQVDRGRRHRRRVPAGGRLTGRAVIAALGHALLREDAGFHWFQVYEAGVRQALAWPEGSEESTLILVGVARWLAAHTPTMRELPTVVRIATRLRRGEALFEEALTARRLGHA